MPSKAGELPLKARAMHRTGKDIAIDAHKARPVLEQIGSKWSVLILIALCAGPARFNAIKRRLDGVTHKALADALKRLERNGLVRRDVLPTSPVGVQYTITPLAMSLKRPLAALYDWALAHSAELERAQGEFDAKSDRG